MPQLLARDIPEETMLALKARAKLNHRSLSGEVRAILVKAVSGSKEDPVVAANRIRMKIAASGISQTDSGELQAEDRER